MRSNIRLLRPLVSDRSTTVPGVACGGERGEAARRADLSRLANAVASLERAGEVGLEGCGPIGDMVQALVARLQKVAKKSDVRNFAVTWSVPF